MSLWAEIRHAHNVRHEAKRSIARRLGVDRKTVARVVAEVEARAGRRSPRRGRRLSPYAAEGEAHLDADPELTAKRLGAVLAERHPGLALKARTLREFVAAVRSGRAPRRRSSIGPTCPAPRWRSTSAPRSSSSRASCDGRPTSSRRFPRATPPSPRSTPSSGSSASPTGSPRRLAGSAGSRVGSCSTTPRSPCARSCGAPSARRTGPSRPSTASSPSAPTSAPSARGGRRAASRAASGTCETTASALGCRPRHRAASPRPATPRPRCAPCSQRRSRSPPDGTRRARSRRAGAPRLPTHPARSPRTGRPLRPLRLGPMDTIASVPQPGRTSGVGMRSTRNPDRPQGPKSKIQVGTSDSYSRRRCISRSTHRTASPT